MPKPPKKESEQVTLLPLEEYEKMDDLEYAHQPLELIDRITEAAMIAGKVPRTVSWGDYKSGRPLLPALQERAISDFKYYNDAITAMLTSRENMLKEQENFKKMQEMMPQVDRDQAKDEMGAWIANYFDDAGYVDWEKQCTMYKSMLMNAFPPIDPLDDVKPYWTTMPIDKWEENLLTFLNIMSSHIVTHKKRAPAISGGTFANLFRRR